MSLEPLSGKAALSIRHRQHSVVIYEGSVRSGKTVTSLLAWLEFVRTGPAGPLLMVGKTERTLKRNIIGPLVEMLGPKRCRHNVGTGELWLLGRMIYTAGANDARAEDRIRGLTLAGAYVDEVSNVPEQFFAMLLSRLSVDGARLFGTSNPDNPNHWLMRDHLTSPAVWIKHDGTVVVSDDPDAIARDLARFSFNMRDNPSLSQSYVARLAATYVGLWRKRFIEGLWVLAEGAIFDTFDPDPASRYIVNDADLPRDQKTGALLFHEMVVCVDYGTTNPFDAILLGVGYDDRIFALREWRHDSRKAKRQMTDAEYSAALRNWLADLDPMSNDIRSELPGARDPARIIVDPSAASFIAQLYRDDWGGVGGADNTVADGIRSVASLLECGRLLIHESCADLRAELSGYVWDEKAALAGDEKPLKVDDHACLIAGTSVTTDRGDMPIERVRRGDRVLTRQGWAAVKWAGRTGKDRPVVTVTTTDGRSFTGTGNHPVWTVDRGWVRVGSLRYGDTLETCDLRLSSSTESPSAVTQSHHAGRTGSTSLRARLTAKLAFGGTTKNCGSQPTDPSPKVTTFTTSTSTRRTTISATLPASQKRITRKFTGPDLSNAARPIRHLGWLARRPPSGTGATRAEPGTSSMAGELGRTGSPPITSAIAVADRSIRSRLATPPGSVRTPARASGDVMPGSTMPSSNANAAGRPSPPTDTTDHGSAGVRVLSVTPSISPADVFNLTVDGPPEFYANGVLVHNCDALRYGVMGLRRWWRHWLSA